jgi:hypothetical protein
VDVAVVAAVITAGALFICSPTSNENGLIARITVAVGTAMPVTGQDNVKCMPLTLSVLCCFPLQPRGAKDRNKRRALQRFGLSGDDVEPPVDGVFRAVPADSSSLQEGASSVGQAKDGRWVATLNLGGELYQAFFVQQDDALEALNAAGYAAQVTT